MASLEHWSWASLPPAGVEKQIDWHERLTFGPLRGRDATIADNEAFSELWANAPEVIDDWEITTERAPDAFAQFRLQQNVQISLIADGPRLVACVAWSRRNVLVQGQRLSVTYGQALRVHREYRRQGFGDQVRRLPWGVAVTRPNATQYDLMRSQNFAVVNWWKKYDPDFFAETPQQEGEVPGVPVSVAQLPARALAADDPAIREARPADLARCAELHNRTHEGLDLFRPYTAEFLEDVLDEGFWGERPPWHTPVYAWGDYFVLEEGGRIRACAGLWDRGRDVRDRWRRVGHEEERVISDAAVLDLGYEAGAEQAMERLLGFLRARTHALGRDNLLVPLDPLPELAARLERWGPVPETRYLRWGLPDPVVERPHTDLRYW